MSTDRIEKRVVLRAPLDRVWRAISDAEEFGRWFGVRFDGPFVEGASITAAIVPTTVDDEVARRQAAARRGEEHLADRRDRTAAALRLPLASVRDRPGCRLRPGADHAGRVHPVGDARRRAAHHHRIRLRRHPARRAAPPRSRPTPRAGPSRPTWCAGTSRAPGYERAAVGGRAALRRARGPQSAAHHRSALRSRPELDIASHHASFRSTRQAASKHLQLLESAGLVTSSRRGRERIWTVRTEPLARASDYLTQLSRRWDAAVDRLRAFVEGERPRRAEIASTAVVRAMRQSPRQSRRRRWRVGALR